MRVRAVSDMHGQLLQIPDCACSGGSPIDSPSPLSPEPDPVPVDSSLRPPHTPYERFDPGHRHGVRYRIGDQGDLAYLDLPRFA